MSWSRCRATDGSSTVQLDWARFGRSRSGTTCLPRAKFSISAWLPGGSQRLASYKKGPSWRGTLPVYTSPRNAEGIRGPYNKALKLTRSAMALASAALAA